MLKLLDKNVTDKKLSDELVAAGIPVKGIAHLSRELDENGRAVLENGKPKKVTRYLLIKGDFTSAQETIIRNIVADHVPDPDPTAVELEDARKEAIVDTPLNTATMKADAKRTGIPFKEYRDGILEQLEV